MRVEYAELPESLVRAHKDGSLVLFVGAGASEAAPSCLPLFDDLAKLVDDELGIPRDDSIPPEKRLEERVNRLFALKLGPG